MGKIRVFAGALAVLTLVLAGCVFHGRGAGLTLTWVTALAGGLLAWIAARRPRSWRERLLVVAGCLFHTAVIIFGTTLAYARGVNEGVLGAFACLGIASVVLSCWAFARRNVRRQMNWSGYFQA